MSSSQRMQGDSPAHTHARSLHCQDGFRSCSSQRDVPEHQEVRPSFPPASTHTCPPSQLVTSPLQPLEQLSLRQSVFIPGLEWPQDLGAAAVGASPAQPALGSHTGTDPLSSEVPCDNGQVALGRCQPLTPGRSLGVSPPSRTAQNLLAKNTLGIYSSSCSSSRATHLPSVLARNRSLVSKQREMWHWNKAGSAQSGQDRGHGGSQQSTGKGKPCPSRSSPACRRHTDPIKSHRSCICRQHVIVQE